MVFFRIKILNTRCCQNKKKKKTRNCSNRGQKQRILREMRDDVNEEDEKS